MESKSDQLLLMTHDYDDHLKTKIGRYAAENGNASTVTKFSKDLGWLIHADSCYFLAWSTGSFFMAAVNLDYGCSHSCWSSSC